ncbi:polysaccharide pyruvyl transferase family protein [Brucella abortus]|nr:polysaccharide pyruvyl transferase family protein [Brucella abortus]
MADMAEGLLASGYRIRLLTGDISDLMAVDDLMARLAAPARANIVFEPVTSLNGLMQQIAHTDIVVASRYHNIVCALATGRPAISLGYAAKNDALLHDAGLDRFCHHIEDFDPQTVLMQVRQMFANLEQLREGVEAGVARYRLHLARQEEVLPGTAGRSAAHKPAGGNADGGANLRSGPIPGKLSPVSRRRNASAAARCQGGAEDN